jgi:hypothetical protein
VFDLASILQDLRFLSLICTWSIAAISPLVAGETFLAIMQHEKFLKE